MELYDQMSSFVYGVALRITAAPAVADRITEEVFLRVWTHPEELDGHGTKVRTRLAVLTHDRAVEAVRQERAAAAAQVDTIGAGRGETERFSDGQELAEALGTAARVQEALAALAPEQRLALEVTYFGGNTYVEAAVILGVPSSVVARQVSEALRVVLRSVGRAAAEPLRTVRLDGAAVEALAPGAEGVDRDGPR
jgi:RNA polymerase sigma-70 factor (ECF subfamily)